MPRTVLSVTDIKQNIHSSGYTLSIHLSGYTLNRAFIYQAICHYIKQSYLRFLYKRSVNCCVYLSDSQSWIFSDPLVSSAYTSQACTSWNSEGTALKVGSEYYSNSCSRSDWGRPADNTNTHVPASARRIWDRVKAQPAACTSPAGRIRECALMVSLLITRQVRKALYKHLVPWSSACPSTVSFTVGPATKSTSVSIIGL